MFFAEGISTLHVAVVRGSVRVVQMLLEYGAPLGSRDVLGNTEAHTAALLGDFVVLQLLLDFGADLSARNHDGHSVEGLVLKCHRVTVGEALASILRGSPQDSIPIISGASRVRGNNARTTALQNVAQPPNDYGARGFDIRYIFAQAALLRPVHTDADVGTVENQLEPVPHATLQLIRSGTGRARRDAEAAVEKATRGKDPVAVIALRRKHRAWLAKVQDAMDMVQKRGLVDVTHFSSALQLVFQHGGTDTDEQATTSVPDKGTVASANSTVPSNHLLCAAAMLFHLHDYANESLLTFSSFSDAVKRWCSMAVHHQHHVLRQATSLFTKRIPGLSWPAFHVALRPMAPRGDLSVPMMLHSRIPQKSLALSTIQRAYRHAVLDHDTTCAHEITCWSDGRMQCLLSAVDAIVDANFSRQHGIELEAQKEGIRQSRLTAKAKAQEAATTSKPLDNRLLFQTVSAASSQMWPELCSQDVDIAQTQRQLRHLVEAKGCSVNVECVHDGPAHAWRTWADVPQGWTPLMVACRGGNAALVKLLLDGFSNASDHSDVANITSTPQPWRADPKFITASMGEGETPLLTAVRHNKLEVVRVLLSHSGSGGLAQPSPLPLKSPNFDQCLRNFVNTCNDCLESPVYVAIIGGSRCVPVLKLLLEAKASITTSKAACSGPILDGQAHVPPPRAPAPRLPSGVGPFGETPLSAAAALGAGDVVELLANYIERNEPQQKQRTKHHPFSGDHHDDASLWPGIIDEQLAGSAGSLGDPLSPLQMLLLQCRFGELQPLLRLYPPDSTARSAAELLCQQVFQMPIAATSAVASFSVDGPRESHQQHFWFGNKFCCSNTPDHVPADHVVAAADTSFRSSSDVMPAESRSETPADVCMSIPYYLRLLDSVQVSQARDIFIAAYQNCWRAQQALLRVPTQIVSVSSLELNDLLTPTELANRQHEFDEKRNVDKNLYTDQLRVERAQQIRREAAEHLHRCIIRAEDALKNWLAVFDAAEALPGVEKGGNRGGVFSNDVRDGSPCTGEQPTTLEKNVMACICKRLGPKWLHAFVSVTIRHLLLRLRGAVHHQSVFADQRCTAGAFSCLSDSVRSRLLIARGISGTSTAASNDWEQMVSTIFDDWTRTAICGSRGLAASLQLFGPTTDEELSKPHLLELLVQRCAYAGSICGVSVVAGAVDIQYDETNCSTSCDGSRLIRAAACGDRGVVLRQLLRVGVPVFAPLSPSPPTVPAQQQQQRQSHRVHGRSNHLTALDTSATNDIFACNELDGATALRAAVLANQPKTVRLILRVLSHANDATAAAQLLANAVRKKSPCRTPRDSSNGRRHSGTATLPIHEQLDSSILPVHVSHLSTSVIPFAEYVASEPSVLEVAPRHFFQTFSSHNCTKWLIPQPQGSEIQPLVPLRPGLTVPALRELATALLVASYRGYSECVKELLDGTASVFGSDVAKFLLRMRTAKGWTCLHFAAQISSATQAAEHSSQAETTRCLESILCGPIAEHQLFGLAQSTCHEQDGDQGPALHEDCQGRGQVKVSMIELLQAREFTAGFTPLGVAATCRQSANLKDLQTALVRACRAVGSHLAVDVSGASDTPHEATNSNLSSSCSDVADLPNAQRRRLSALAIVVQNGDLDGFKALTGNVPPEQMVGYIRNSQFSDLPLLSVAAVFGHHALVHELVVLDSSMQNAEQEHLDKFESSEVPSDTCTFSACVSQPMLAHALFTAAMAFELGVVVDLLSRYYAICRNDLNQPFLIDCHVDELLQPLKALTFPLDSHLQLRAPSEEQRTNIQEQFRLLCGVDLEQELRLHFGALVSVNTAGTSSEPESPASHFSVQNLLQATSPSGAVRRVSSAVDKDRVVGQVQRLVRKRGRRAFQRYAGSAPLRPLPKNGGEEAQVFRSHYRCAELADDARQMARMSFAQFRRFLREELCLPRSVTGGNLCDSASPFMTDEAKTAQPEGPQPYATGSDQLTSQPLGCNVSMCSLLFARMCDGSGTVSEPAFLRQFHHLLYVRALCQRGIKNCESPTRDLPAVSTTRDACGLTEGDRVRYCGPLNNTYSHHPGVRVDDRPHPWKFANTGTVLNVRCIFAAEWQPKKEIDIEALPGRQQMLDDEAKIPGSREFRRRAAELAKSKSHATDDSPTSGVSSTSSGALAQYFAQQTAISEGQIFVVADVMWDNVRYCEVEMVTDLELLGDREDHNGTVALESRRPVGESACAAPRPLHDTPDETPNKTQTSADSVCLSGDRRPPQASDSVSARPRSSGSRPSTARARRRARERAQQAEEEAARRQLAPIPGGKMTPEAWVQLIQGLHSPLPEWYEYLWPRMYIVPQRSSLQPTRHEPSPHKSDSGQAVVARDVLGSMHEAPPPPHCIFPNIPTSRDMVAAIKWTNLVKKLCFAFEDACKDAMDARDSLSNFHQRPSWFPQRGIDVDQALASFRFY